MFPEVTKFQIKAFIAIFFLVIFLEWTLIYFQVDKLLIAPKQNSKVVHQVEAVPLKTEKIVIGLVSCQAKYKSTPERLFYGMEINEGSLVTIKSILISARLYKVLEVEFHIFVEKEDDPAWFHKQFVKNNWVEDVGVEVKIYFHSAVDAVPDKYKKYMVYHIPYRCGFVKMFFPSALPDVDSIIYMNTDMIVTGNIAELWNHLGKMENEEVIGVARNNEPENNFVNILPGFGDILPLHEKAPKGLNSGLLVMNLTKMREHHWQERFLRLFDDFSKIYDNMEDQRTLNLFAYFDPGQIHLVPCQFNLIHTNCDYGWFCGPALNDPYGVHVVHGAGNQFEGTGRFKSIFRAYRNFTWRSTHHLRNKSSVEPAFETLRKIFAEKVAKQVRNSYELHNRLGRNDLIKRDSKCYGTLNRLLFKNFETVLKQ